jgi:hypothetical protein
MQSRTLTIPTLALVAGTRGILGAGIGLLLASRLSEARRRGIGSWLFAVGLFSTIPLALRVFRSKPSRTVTPAGMSGDAHEETPLRRGRHQMLPIANPQMLPIHQGHK